jgi:hypothetical protein
MAAALAELRKAGYSSVAMSNKPSAQMPLLISLALVIVGLVITAIGGFSSGSIAGGLIAGAGVIPAAWAAWAGIQQETQKSLAGAIGMVVLSLGVGGLLLLLKVVDWLR